MKQFQLHTKLEKLPSLNSQRFYSCEDSYIKNIGECLLE